MLQHEERAGYGKQVLERLSKDLNASQTELSYMLQFARAYPIYAPAHKLSWSHYRELLILNDSKEREEVTQQAEKQGWSRDQVREEVRRRQHGAQVSSKLPETKPGPLHTYQIIRLKGRLKIDLGFGIYLDLPKESSKKFKEGDMIQATHHLSIVTTPVSSVPLYTYEAQVTQMVDGDTFHALIDLGFGITQAQRVRLRRIDAPELVTADGKTAKAYLEKILSRDDGRVILQSHDLDQHGRPIADVWVKGKPVDQELLDQGLVIPLSE